MIGNRLTGNKLKADFSVRAGFTLIEVIVSVALFSIIILAATNIFTMVLNTQRNSMASQNVQESLKYFLEVIGKEMRMAQKDTTNLCGIPSGQIFIIGTDTNGNKTLYFKNYYDQCVTYSLANDLDHPTVKRFKIQRNIASDFISPEEVTIDHLYFVLNSGTAQPMVTINLAAHSTQGKKLNSAMTIQTSLTSRYYK